MLAEQTGGARGSPINIQNDFDRDVNLKRLFTQKFVFCHCLVIIMSFQPSMILYMVSVFYILIE